MHVPDSERRPPGHFAGVDDLKRVPVGEAAQTDVQGEMRIAHRDWKLVASVGGNQGELGSRKECR